MICSASAPEPAPNSQTSSVPVAARLSAICSASAWPNSGDNSGAVMKSLPEAGRAPNLREALA